MSERADEAVDIDEPGLLDDIVPVESETLAQPDGLEPQPSGNAAQSLRELVLYLVTSLVDDPGAVSVDVQQRGSLVQIQLRLPEEELGKVIGRGGRIAKAMRTALMIAGSRHNLRVSLDIES